MSKISAAAARFCSFPREHREEYKSVRDTQKEALSSLNELAKARSSKAIVTRLQRVYKNFWLSEEEAQEEEFLLREAGNLLINHAGIFQELAEWSEDASKKPSTGTQQAIYLAWNREAQKENLEVERENSNPISNIMGFRQQVLLHHDRLRKAIERRSSSHSQFERLVTLPRIDVLLGGLSGATGLWIYAIQALSLTACGPLVVFGVPAVVGLIVMGLKAYGASISDKLHARTHSLIKLDTEVMNPLNEIFEKVTSAIFRTDDATQGIQKDVKDIKVVGHQLVDAVDRTDKNTQAIAEDTTAIKQVGSQLIDSVNRTDDTTQKMQKDLHNGVEKLNQIAESQARIEANQQPATVHVHHYNIEGTMKLLLEAHARGEISQSLFLAAIERLTALQITEASSSANESPYLLPQQGLLATPLAESSSVSTSRSSTPASELPSSSKGKGKAVDTVVISAEEAEEFAKWKEQRLALA